MEYLAVLRKLFVFLCAMCIGYEWGMSFENGTSHSNLPVEIGGARACDLLLALGHIEKHGLIRLRPLEVEAFLDAISWSGTEHY